MTANFIMDVRQELAVVTSPDARLEVALLLRLGGQWHRRGTVDGMATSIELTTRSGAVARRTFALLRDIGAPPPRIWVRAPGGVVARSTYGVHVEDEVVLRELGVLVDDGRPVAGLPAGSMDAPEITIRAALLACGSVSTPGRPVHLEFATPSARASAEMAGLVTAVAGPATVTDEDRHRVVVKSGTVVADLLALAGCRAAVEIWREQQMRHGLRAAANRLANADTANVERSVRAARLQIEAIELVTDVLGWHALELDVKRLALTRLANPAASLEELGELCDPPLTKSAVHRRLSQLRQMANELEARS